MPLSSISTKTLISELSLIDMKELQTLLQKQGYNLEVDGYYGPITLKCFNEFKNSNYLGDLDYIGPTTYKALLKVNTNPSLITYKLLDLGMPYATTSDINIYLLPLQKYTSKYYINTPLRIAAFLAQLAHESGSFKYKKEIASGAAYEGRVDLGNVKPGDGKRYKGRGLIQLTGRANYRKYGQVLQLDLENNPELAMDPTVAVQIACEYWKQRGLNTLADTGNIKEITRRINGGYNGLADRTSYYNKFKQLLNI